MIANQPVVEFVALSEARNWQRFLSDGERVVAGGISHPAVRARFEVVRGLRRKMLSEAAGLSAADLMFIEPDGGKPRTLNASGWDFNVSHSGDHVVAAVGQGRVGVDLEQIRPVRDMESIVDRYFHPDEAGAWRVVAPSRREAAFFVLWSAREASMKCVGLGLARGLSITRVDPEILSGGIAPARVGGATVEVRQIAAPRGYVAMLAQAAA